MTDLIPFEGKQPIVMKSGLIHWVSIDTAERLQQQLQTQTAHSFVKLRESNMTINTTEVEGVYTMDQYEALSKVKEGMWQCIYRNWHNKGKRECECKKDYYRRQEQHRKGDAEREANRPLTDEERQRHQGRMRSMRETLETRGILTPKRIAKAPVRQTIEADEGMPDFLD